MHARVAQELCRVGGLLAQIPTTDPVSLHQIGQFFGGLVGLGIDATATLTAGYQAAGAAVAGRSRFYKPRADGHGYNPQVGGSDDMDGITLKKTSQIEAYSGPHAIEGIRFRAVREALGVSAWGMNLLELDPHCSGYPEHSHDKDRQEEVYLVVRGSIVLQASGEELVLQEGDFVRVAPNISRKFVTRDQGATLLALGGTPGQAYSPSMGG